MTRRSETEVLRHYIQVALFKTTLTKIQYAADVVDHFLQTVPEKDRHTKDSQGGIRSKLYFHRLENADSTDDLVFKKDENRKKIFAYIGGTNHMPIVLRRSLIECLPPELMRECYRDLYRDEGHLAVKLPTPKGDSAHLGEFYREQGEVMHAGQRIFRDGVVSEKDDLADLEVYRKELNDMIEEATSHMAHVDQVIANKVENKNGSLHSA